MKEKSDASRVLSLKGFMEGNRSLSGSLEEREKEPGRLHCCFIYTYQIEVEVQRVESN